jgi:hypothetical protein
LNQEGFVDELYRAAQAALLALEASKGEMMTALQAAQTLAGYEYTNQIIAERAAQYKAHEDAIDGLKRALSHQL